MNLKEELQKMNIRDLKSICKELGLSCSTDKINIIKKLLEPLKKRYNIEILKYHMNSGKEDWELVLDRMEKEEKKEEKERRLYEILRKPVRKYITKKRRTKKRAVKTIQRAYKRFKKLKELEKKKSKKRMLTKTEKKSKAKCILWLINYKFGKKEHIPKHIKNLKLKLYKKIKNLEKQDKDKKISDNDKKLRFLWSNSKINLNSLNSNTLLTQKEREELEDEGIDLLSVPWISKDN